MAELLLQVPEQVHDLGLDGNVECACGLIGYDELRAHGKHTRDAHPPFFAAGELVREVREFALFEAHLLQSLADAFLHGAFFMKRYFLVRAFITHCVCQP